MIQISVYQASDVELCCICFEQACTIEVQKCGHQMCAHCALALCCYNKPNTLTNVAKAPVCPFCRSSISQLVVAKISTNSDAGLESSPSQPRSRLSFNLNEGSCSFKSLSSLGSFGKIGGRSSGKVAADSDQGLDKLWRLLHTHPLGHGTSSRFDSGINGHPRLRIWCNAIVLMLLLPECSLTKRKIKSWRLSYSLYKLRISNILICFYGSSYPCIPKAHLYFDIHMPMDKLYSMLKYLIELSLSPLPTKVKNLFQNLSKIFWWYNKSPSRSVLVDDASSF